MTTTTTTGIKTVIFPVKDLAKAKALFRALMGEPAYEAPYYVGYNIEGQDIGLDPNGHRNGMTGPVCYWHVGDIQAARQALLDAGAEAQNDVRDVGGGRLIATVKDADGNAIGLLQNP
jgi:predicted enzyme related to lactoylglutathione lyase